MTNVTLNIDDALLRRARIRALQDGTSVNSLVKSFLESYAGNSDTASSIERFISRAAQGEAGSGAGGRTWNREDLHSRATLR